jgi:hypothetical protein
VSADAAYASAAGDGGPLGIASVTPSWLASGSTNQRVLLTLDERFAPPGHVAFTSVTLGEIEAIAWSRSGLTLRAWFDLPAQLTAGAIRYALSSPDVRANRFSS